MEKAQLEQEVERLQKQNDSLLEALRRRDEQQFQEEVNNAKAEINRKIEELVTELQRNKNEQQAALSVPVTKYEHLEVEATKAIARMKWMAEFETNASEKKIREMQEKIKELQAELNRKDQDFQIALNAKDEMCKTEAEALKKQNLEMSLAIKELYEDRMKLQSKVTTLEVVFRESLKRIYGNRTSTVNPSQTQRKEKSKFNFETFSLLKNKVTESKQTEDWNPNLKNHRGSQSRKRNGSTIPDDVEHVQTQPPLKFQIIENGGNGDCPMEMDRDVSSESSYESMVPSELQTKVADGETRRKQPSGKSPYRVGDASNLQNGKSTFPKQLQCCFCSELFCAGYGKPLLENVRIHDVHDYDLFGYCSGCAAILFTLRK